MTSLQRLFHRHDWVLLKIHGMPPKGKRKFFVNMWVYRCKDPKCKKFGFRPVKAIVKK